MNLYIQKWVVIISVLIGCGSVCLPALAATLADIETAVMSEEYHQAKVAALEFLSMTSRGAEATEARYYLGVSLLRLGEYDTARETLQEALRGRTTPQIRTKIYLGLFEAAYSRGQYDEALEIMKKAHRSKPAQEMVSVLYLKQARAHLKLAQWQEAQALLSRIVTTFPQSMEAVPARQLLEEKQFFAVQVGAFTECSRAKSLVDSLKATGEYAYIVEMTDAQNRTLYRVRVGEFARLDDAEMMRGKLSQQGYPAKVYP